MEKIRVIEEKCIGCGACVATCPEVFDFDDEGYAKAINDNINSLDAEIKENAIDAVVFPNPTPGNLNINAEGMTNVSVYNMVGQKVVDLEVDSDQYILDMSSMEVGVYMLKVVSRNGEMTQRIVLM